jgi:hypothetical protein
VHGRLDHPRRLRIDLRRAEPLEEFVDPGLPVGLGPEDADGEQHPFEQEAVVPGACRRGDGAELLAAAPSLAAKVAALREGVGGEVPREELGVRVAGGSRQPTEIAGDLLAALQRARFPQAHELGVQHPGGEQRIAVSARRAGWPPRSAARVALDSGRT